MRIVIQRVKAAKVEIDGVTVAAIGAGLLVLAGIARTNTEREADYLAGKLSQLRVFPDAAGKMNLSVQDAGAEVLLAPNFLDTCAILDPALHNKRLAGSPLRRRRRNSLNTIRSKVRKKAGQVVYPRIPHIAALIPRRAGTATPEAKLKANSRYALAYVVIWSRAYD